MAELADTSCQLPENKSEKPFIEHYAPEMDDNPDLKRDL